MAKGKAGNVSEKKEELESNQCGNANEGDDVTAS